MKLSTALPASLVLLVGFGLGFGLGRATAPGDDPELATLASFRRALEDPDWLTRSYRLSGFLQHLSPENLPGALEALEPQLPWLLTDELRVFMLAWSRFDPLGALEHALSWPRPFNRNGAGAAIYAWALRNPSAAAWALRSVEDPDLKEFMEGRLIAGWTHGEHRDSASDYIAKLPEGRRRFGYIGMLAWELSKQGPEAVMRWAESVPDAPERYKASVFLQAGNTLAAVDPAATAGWLAGHADRVYADGVLRVVARSWANSDPPAALDWMMQLPAGEKRNGAVKNAFRVWHNRSPEAAERWLRAAAPEPALDAAVRLMVGGTRREAPVLAMEWALEVADPELREQVVVNVARLWLRADAGAARAWLARSDLAPRVRGAILAPAPPPDEPDWGLDDETRDEPSGAEP